MNENVATPAALRDLDMIGFPSLEHSPTSTMSAELRPRHWTKLTVTGLFAESEELKKASAGRVTRPPYYAKSIRWRGTY